MEVQKGEKPEEPLVQEDTKPEVEKEEESKTEEPMWHSLPNIAAELLISPRLSLPRLLFLPHTSQSSLVLR